MLAAAPPPPPAGDGEPEPGEPGAALLLLLDQDRVPVTTPHSFQPGLDMSAMFNNYFQNGEFKTFEKACLKGQFLPVLAILRQK